MKKYGWGIAYGLLLTLFTVYVLLDTFVIARVYSEVPQGKVETVDKGNPENREESVTVPEETKQQEESEKTEEPGDEESEEPRDEEPETPEMQESPKPVWKTPVITENSYDDGLISIVITEYREYDTAIYAAEVKLASAEYLRTALAKNSYGRNVTQRTSTMAANNNAILAVNGDYYGAREKGYVLRNGVLYRETAAKDQEDLVIYPDGSFEIITESEVSAAELYEKGAQQVLAFGPALVTDGEISVTEWDEVGQASASNPRTAIGIIDELHYIIVVSDGRTRASAGLSLYELALFMQSQGAKTAYNLDGGGSATMVFNNKIVNLPTTNGWQIKERSVSDCVFIGY